MSSVNSVGGCVRERWERGGERSQLKRGCSCEEWLAHRLEQVYAQWLWCSVWISGAVRRLN
eukprot:4231991-Prymnesium_polylepis.1